MPSRTPSSRRRATASTSRGASIYVNTQPCIVCAKMLINAGIDEIVYQNPYPDELAMSMLEEAGMKLRVFDL